MVAPSQLAVQHEPYESDLTDEQWEMIRPFVEVQAKTGPRRRVDLRAVLNGLLYKLKTSCQWELLPRSFPPKSTVHYYFQRWTKKGIWVRLNDVLRRRVRVEVEGREHVEATGGVIDTQSAKSSLAGGPERGFDGGKKVFGRKRHLLTDTLGLLITAVVHSARLYDGTAAKQVFTATKARGIALKKVWPTRPIAVRWPAGWRTTARASWRSSSGCPDNEASRSRRSVGWWSVHTPG